MISRLRIPSRPHIWYPLARRKKRNIFLHVGPTNSGKTYHALKQLESISSGLYCGPLSLLAWEVAKRLNKAYVPCNLITGQEREEIKGATHNSVTVEMADVTCDYHCAVIDEIQALEEDIFELQERSRAELLLVGGRLKTCLIEEFLERLGWKRPKARNLFRRPLWRPAFLT